MYAESGQLFPYFRNFSQEVQELEEFCYSHKPTSPMDSISIPTSTILDYDDLFNSSSDLDIESLQNELLEKTSTESSGSGTLLQPVMAKETQRIEETKFLSPFIKCGSSSSLSSMERLSVRPSFLDFPECDFVGMRRAFSEGDIKWSLVDYSRIHEDRSQKLSRYRDKKARRNFGTKIKYACRKALADTQPRIRGRFAKSDSCKKH